MRTGGASVSVSYQYQAAQLGRTAFPVAGWLVLDDDQVREVGTQGTHLILLETVCLAQIAE